MFLKVPTFRLNLQSSSGESEKITRKKHVTYSVPYSDLLLSSCYLFPKPKDPVPKDHTRGAIYSIPCKDCDKSYIGETKRKFSTRLKEHQKAVEHKHSQKSALAEHCLRSGHTVSWEASKILRISANWRNRRILEAWEINICRNPLNRDDGMHLPHEFLNLALGDRT